MFIQKKGMAKYTCTFLWMLASHTCA